MRENRAVNLELPRTRSHRSPFLVCCEEYDTRYNKPFMFLKLWTKHDNFKEIARQNGFPIILRILLFLLRRISRESI